MEVRSLAFRTDLALLELGGATVEDRGDHLLIRTPDNPRFWWGNFLLLPQVPIAGDLDRWAERHAEEIPGAAHVALGFDATAGAPADLAACAERGLDVEVSTVMTARRTHPPRSRHRTAINRALTTDDDWEQSVLLTLRSFPDEGTAGYEEFVRARCSSCRRMVEDGHGRWSGAFLDGRLVAQLGLLRAGSGLARFQAVETDPDLRRQGLAGGLVYDATRYGFDELSATTLVMVADPDYVAVGLYRAVGFADTEMQLQAAGRRG